jgi:hypothetical protein
VTVDRGRCADQLDRRRGYARPAVGSRPRSRENMVAVNADALVRLTRAVLPAISPTPLRYRLPLWSPTTATAIADRLGLAAPPKPPRGLMRRPLWPRRSTSRPTSATTRGSLTFSRMSASRTGNDTPTQRGAPQCGYPSFVGGTACTGGDLTHYCCGGTVHLVEMAIDPVVTLFFGTCWCTT